MSVILDQERSNISKMGSSGRNGVERFICALPITIIVELRHIGRAQRIMVDGRYRRQWSIRRAGRTARAIELADKCGNHSISV